MLDARRIRQNPQELRDMLTRRNKGRRHRGRIFKARMSSAES